MLREMRLSVLNFSLRARRATVSASRLLPSATAPLHSTLSIIIRPPELQDPLVVVVIFLLVGVDEGEIEAAGATAVDQALQGVDRRRQAQLDAAVDAGPGPIAAGHGRELLADVAGDQFAVRRQGER